jgi:asparagine synthase (glutamine-hydrolysing)
MCGIAGFVDFASARSPSANRVLAGAMGEAMKHRGPDGAAIWSGPDGLWLSFRRLAILDLSEAGDQPMVTPDGQGVLIFNGEAYNAAELKPELEAAGYRFRGHSDAEAVLYGCHHWGVARTVQRLIGMFAFAYWDGRRKNLTLARDRLGKKPIYWFRTQRSFAFASELRPLLLHEDCPREIDRNSVADLLSFHYVPAPYSIFGGVQKLQPATLLTLDVAGRSVKTETYWDLSQQVSRALQDPFAGTDDEAIAETERLLLEATRLRLISDVPLGAFLSGGIDSSLVTALMQEVGGARARTFSIGYRQADYDEAEDAAKVAGHLGTEHTSFIVEPADVMAVIPDLAAIFDEPFADPSQIPTYLVSRLAREEVTVALTGDGGDEVFGGYNRHVAAHGVLRRLSRLPTPMRAGLSAAMTALSPAAWQRLLNLVPVRARPRAAGEKLHKLAPLLQLDERGQYAHLVRNWQDADAVARLDSRRPAPLDLVAELDFPDAVSRMRYLDVATYLPDDILTKVDRASMAASLETRAPCLDHRLVEWSFRLPSSLHLRDGRGKWLLRKILEKRVPPSLFERPKTGFGVPIGEWLRGPLREWAEHLLDERLLRETGLIDPAPVRSLWQRHLAGTTNGQYLLWPVLMLMSWLDAYATGISSNSRVMGQPPPIAAANVLH